MNVLKLITAAWCLFAYLVTVLVLALSISFFVGGRDCSVPGGRGGHFCFLPLPRLDISLSSKGLSKLQNIAGTVVNTMFARVALIFYFHFANER